jgi:type IV secretory pathway protease TraF
MTPRFVWNASASVPIGLYKVHPAHHLTVAARAVAYPAEPLAGWLEERRYLPRGVPLLKPILALDGQTVCRVGPRITVDGREMGVAHDEDHSGRPLPFWQGCRVIGHSEIFVMNPDEPASLHGRYFGPLLITSIAGVAEPLWTSRAGPVMWPQRRSDTGSPTVRSRMPPGLPSMSPHRGEHHGSHDTHYRLRPDGRPEDHARTDLAPVGR